jgi:uncharacterized membrane protein
MEHLAEPEMPMPALWRISLSIFLCGIIFFYVIRLLTRLPDQDYGYVGIFIIVVGVCALISYTVCTVGDARFTKYSLEYKQWQQYTHKRDDMYHAASQQLEHEERKRLDALVKKMLDKEK